MLRLVYKNEVDENVNQDVFDKILLKFEKILGSHVTDHLGKQDGEIGLVLLNDEAIHSLNRDHRGIDKPTDVLSFAYLEGKRFEGGDDVSVGDIFISVDTASRQSTEKGHSLERELEILFAHGLLHLFGFDHGDDKEEEEMEKWAKEILH